MYAFEIEKLIPSRIQYLWVLISLCMKLFFLSRKMKLDYTQRYMEAVFTLGLESVHLDILNNIKTHTTRLINRAVESPKLVIIDEK